MQGRFSKINIQYQEIVKTTRYWFFGMGEKRWPLTDTLQLPNYTSYWDTILGYLRKNAHQLFMPFSIKSFLMHTKLLWYHQFQYVRWTCDIHSRSQLLPLLRFLIDIQPQYSYYISCNIQIIEMHSFMSMNSQKYVHLLVYVWRDTKQIYSYRIFIIAAEESH